MDVKPPYWLSIGLIVLGIVTATIMPSIVGVFVLLRCIEASKAKARGDFDEARRLSRQAWWNPFGIRPVFGWIIGGTAIVVLVLLLINS